VDDLARIRGLGRGFAEGALGGPLLAAVARGLAVPDDECPRPETGPDLPRNPGAAVDLLKVLLRIACDEAGVASKLVASAAEVEELAALGEEAAVPALHGWRRELFGEAALRMRRGELAIAVDGKKFKLIDLAP
jgi:ribonuclease D